MGKMSNISPLQAKSFGSVTVSVFLNPQEYNRSITSSRSIVFPGEIDIDESVEDELIEMFFSSKDVRVATHT